MNARSANLQCLTVERLSTEIQDRRHSPVELMDSLLDRIAKYDRKLHAFAAGALQSLARLFRTMLHKKPQQCVQQLVTGANGELGGAGFCSLL